MHAITSQTTVVFTFAIVETVKLEEFSKVVTTFRNTRSGTMVDGDYDDDDDDDDDIHYESFEN